LKARTRPVRGSANPPHRPRPNNRRGDAGLGCPGRNDPHPAAGTERRPGYRADHAADALFDLLNDPESGFQRRLVTNGPFESVTGTYYTLSHSGPIEIVGKTSPERAQDALVRLLNELETLDVLEGVSDEDLAIAKKHREVQS